MSDVLYFYYDFNIEMYGIFCIFVNSLITLQHFTVTYCTIIHYFLKYTLCLFQLKEFL
jgi:hypothetical protein